jgi:hydrogenase expression/formation protein HypD
MKHDRYRHLADRLSSLELTRPLRVMEVCGTHTAEFFQTGVKDRFPEGLTLIDGPGCPVCVTPNDYLDRAIEIGRVHNPIITTFGDMIKVPSSYSSLNQERSSGMDIQVVYSPIEALALAEENPEREVMFLSVGFETTAPSEAVVVMEARNREIKNFSLLSGNKITVPAVKALLDMGETEIDGFILPGHVSAIVGVTVWEFIARDYGRPCVVGGFEAEELLRATLSLVEMLEKEETRVSNEYPQVVRQDGNPRALEILDTVFEPSDAEWRGIGVIPGSGLSLREEYAEHDAFKKFPVTPPERREHKGCRCGELLRGLIAPTDCPLFGNACTPEHPVGACMVSSEGPCSAYYKWGGVHA